MQIDVLFQGFPGRSDRGFLGWSSCVLIRMEGRKPILFDTLGFNERYTLISRLQSFGVQPSDIGAVFISHFHFDHAVNFGLFPNASFYLHEEEIWHIEKNGARDLAVPLEMFPALRDCGRLSILSGTSGRAEGIHWLHTPGHTPGLYSLLLEYEGSRWALVSDTIKNMKELLTGHVDMAWDAKRSQSSIQVIREWADLIVPGHDRLLQIIRNDGDVKVKPFSKSSVQVFVPDPSPSAGQTFLLEV
ncbi:hypothetical protein DNHGIG_15500 [Collibacillus ludicampi]|uniref:Metallo-beta-lactamase domain-containing protein n=1 Tax=Collibacillus ludicampi TaxID=2771369 RepID=A0AAV4LE66_9BACL|nr:MBL fold metallo-hydrolase [Collibacillus ludicampi]GIM46001.1 hypothetical protein DNHGIG_15500 [Collibacillus ludicampi]